MTRLARMKRLLGRLVRGEVSRGRLDAFYLDACMNVIMRAGESGAGVVIVGANDGKFNDPIYDALLNNPHTTRVLAIEPQSALMPVLRANFDWHPRFLPYCGAVGDGREFSLFTVSPDCWEDLVVPYAAGWPRHRAPSGVASGNRSRVEAWIQRFLPDGPKRSGALVEEKMVADSLPSVIAKSGFQEPVDILQIDVEGLDDVVLLNSDLARLRPQVVRFEHKHLDNRRRYAVLNLLSDLGYRRQLSDQDCVALRSRGEV